MKNTPLSAMFCHADADLRFTCLGRVFMMHKGGDIDLLVLSKRINLMSKLDILVQLHQRLGDRKIDLVVYPDATRPFPRMVMQEGVRL